MDFSKLNELRTGNLVLRKLSENDRQFISEMFNDNSVRKYYIVPKEARQDYRNLVAYFMNDFAQGSGFSWIIIEKGKGIFSKDKACGFFAFEFRDSLQNARISYALKPEFRGKGIVSKSASLVIDALKSLGVTSIEADVDKDNLTSEKVVEKLGFTTNKRQALVDPEMMREGEIRFRFLWRKDLFLKTVNDSKSNQPEISSSEKEYKDIESLKGKIFKGALFNSGFYADSLGEAESNGYSYSNACFKIGNNTMIAAGTAYDESPRDFIDNNQNNNFTVDTSKSPITKNGKTIYFAKKC